MAGAPFSSEIFNAREEVLSGDLNRLQTIASRELQDTLSGAARSDDTLDGADPQNGVGQPISGADILPTLTAASGFTMDLSFGQAYLQDGTLPAVDTGADTSEYQVVRWAQQNLTFANPDATNPRIDLVVATPGSVSTDVASRNILLDPNLRTVAAASVAKTSNPLATIAVVTGTPGATPDAPALPTGALALYEVLVPASATDSTAFTRSRRIWRRAVGLGATLHGVVHGCVPIWTDVLETSVAPIQIASTGDPVHRAVIDGELISFSQIGLLGAAPGIVVDTLNSPFAAPPAHDAPYYLYLCGGRNLPQGRISPSKGLQPVCMVESLTAPDGNGRPSAPIATPRGNTQAGALYIGVGFVVAGTTNRKGVFYDGDWVYARTSSLTLGFSTITLVGFNDVDPRTVSTSVATAVPLNTVPAKSTVAEIVATFNSSTPGDVMNLGRLQSTVLEIHLTLLTGSPYNMGTFHWKLSGNITAGIVVDAGATLHLLARGYNMNVSRYSR